ncbi:hypothetical protein [Cuspidothrix issatschenkoi]|uniref:Uncharacterized protein n=1 Tax=Cuspidothrix issatschenkoi CHARLIE-1 TaxID=2052836 RepID=A0A2S6CTD5_9CYAN|nr:hypothetical protein [Cuspidothrix issatschenkoi]PPJ63035.1 hypothetical protein CUN59_12455 [Cuspidothrix issatschenkoi CHARLIE-1]
MNINFEDFTELQYRYLLQIAKQNWKIIDFYDYQNPAKVCLWRHDLDLSIHRAYRLAQIEFEEGIKATYFIHLHNEFYNFFENENIELLLKIKDLGHDFGLHFDPNFYASRLTNYQDLLDWLQFEREILQKNFNLKIHVFSWHNPDIGNWLNIEEDEIGGMINTYGRYFKENYAYCSDSNGYWRFRRLKDVLESGEDKKLQVLTHPGWWTPEIMSPRDRISRCIDGRAKKQHQKYDDSLKKVGRENIQ